jgi:hypothetical protein
LRVPPQQAGKIAERSIDVVKRQIDDRTMPRGSDDPA